MITFLLKHQAKIVVFIAFIVSIITHWKVMDPKLIDAHLKNPNFSFLSKFWLVVYMILIVLVYAYIGYLVAITTYKLYKSKRSTSILQFIKTEWAIIMSIYKY